MVIINSLLMPVAWHFRPAQDGGEEQSVINREWTDAVTANDVKEAVAMLCFFLLLVGQCNTSLMDLAAVKAHHPICLPPGGHMCGGGYQYMVLNCLRKS